MKSLLQNQGEVASDASNRPASANPSEASQPSQPAAPAGAAKAAVRQPRQSALVFAAAKTPAAQSRCSRQSCRHRAWNIAFCSGSDDASANGRLALEEVTAWLGQLDTLADEQGDDLFLAEGCARIARIS